jgi:hypothetical protein
METAVRTEVKIENLKDVVEVRLPSRRGSFLAHAAKTGVAVVGRDIVDLRVSHVSFRTIPILMMYGRNKVRRLRNLYILSG